MPEKHLWSWFPQCMCNVFNLAILIGNILICIVEVCYIKHVVTACALQAICWTVQILSHVINGSTEIWSR
jgi:hypothetical protein